MILATVVNSVLIMGFLIAIGYYLSRKGIVTAEVEKAFTYMLMNIAIPSLVIKAFNIEYSPEKMQLGLKVIIIGLLYILAVLLLNTLLLKRIGNIDKKKILKYTGVLTNAGFMGFPVIYQIYGNEGTFFASMFYIAVMVYMWTYGMSIFYDRIGKKEMVQMLFNPNMVSVYIGILIFVFSVDIPQLGVRMIDSVGAITTPLAMFIIGARIGKVSIATLFKDRLVYIGTFLRLIFYPAIMILVLNFLNMDPVIEGVCLVYSALPPPAITVVIASRFNGEVDFASKIVVVSHIASLFTIPTMFAVCQFLGIF